MDIHRKLIEFLDEDRCFALAVILEADGSTPQKTGVKAIVDAGGEIFGTLGGGFVEAETQRRAAEACRSKRPLVFDFQLDNAYARRAGAICGGAMRILIDPTVAKDRTCYARAADAPAQRKRGVLLTCVYGTTPPEVTPPEVSVQWFPPEAIPPDGDFPGAEAIGACLATETAQLFVEATQQPGAYREVLVEPVIPRPLLLIVGGGHVGQALARQAIELGFDVAVIDDRPEFTEPSLFPEGVTTCCGGVLQQLAAFPLTAETYVVIVNRGHGLDAETLEACIHAPAAYVGMIGSRRKVDLIRTSFIESGRATEAEFDRVHAPIGLNIGAVTVPEIATSIAAELVAVRRQGGTRRPRESDFPV